MLLRSREFNFARSNSLEDYIYSLLLSPDFLASGVNILKSLVSLLIGLYQQFKFIYFTKQIFLTNKILLWPTPPAGPGCKTPRPFLSLFCKPLWWFLLSKTPDQVSKSCLKWLGLNLYGPVRWKIENEDDFAHYCYPSCCCYIVLLFLN
jgi:hypothetical protein